MMDNNLNNNSDRDLKIEKLERQIDDLVKKFEKHQHTGKDFSSHIKGDIFLSDLEGFHVGQSSLSAHTKDKGSTSELQRLFLLNGVDAGKGLGNSSKNSQITVEHQDASRETFIYAFRPPLYSTPYGAGGISIDGGLDYFIHDKWNWGVDDLVNNPTGTVTLVNIYDSSGILKQTKRILSNTSNVVKVSGVWNFTDNNCGYIIWKPVYFGSAGFVFKRLYTMQDEQGGIRFGVGPTGGGETGMLYMKSGDGNLYFRKTNGAEVQITT